MRLCQNDDEGGVESYGTNAEYLPDAPRYRWQWALTTVCIVLLLALVVFTRMLSRVEPPALPPPDASTYVDWFQLAVLPELPSDPAAKEEYPERLRSWIEALRLEEFVCLPLSRVLARLTSNEGIPEKTLVLLFEPGYRVTYKSVSPIMAEFNVPAVWVTQDPGRHITDRRFLPSHERWLMRRSRLWDIGLRLPEEEGFMLSAVSEARSGKSTIKWAPNGGRCGINFGETSDSLDRLYVNVRWSAAELVDRLLAEIPLRRSTPLTARVIQNRLWGTVPRLSDARPLAFDLHTDINRRYSSVSWLGTSGVPDFKIAFKVRELFGEFWILLRSDPFTGNRILVGFTGRRLRIDFENDGQRTRRADVPYPISPGAALEGIVRLQGRRLDVACEGRNLLNVDDVNVPATAASLLELSASEVLRGAARATGVQLHFTPLPSVLPQG